MNDNFIFNILLVCFSVLLTTVITTHMYYYTIYKKDWHCVKSRIIDNENLDRVECILYERKEND